MEEIIELNYRKPRKRKKKDEEKNLSTSTISTEDFLTRYGFNKLYGKSIIQGFDKELRAEGTIP
jgi:hypothetical protein